MTVRASDEEAGPARLADRYYDAFNARDWDAWLETLDEDVEVFVDAGVIRGRQAALSYVGGILEAYPGVTVSSRQVVAAAGGAVVSEFQLTNVTWSVTGSPCCTERAVPWRLDGVTCDVLKVRENRLVSVHSYYSPAVTDRTPVSPVLSSAETIRIAQRQVAFERVPTDVAGGAEERDLIAVVNQVIAELSGVDVSLVMKFEDDDTAAVLAVSGSVDEPAPIGERLIISGDIRAVRDSGRPLRFGAGGWPLSGALTNSTLGTTIRWCIGVPITLQGRVWASTCSARLSSNHLPRTSRTKFWLSLSWHLLC